jgi:hypothetical protein
MSVLALREIGMSPNLGHLPACEATKSKRQHNANHGHNGRTK